MRANRLRTIWQQGGAAVNGWLQIPHGIAAEAMAQAPWDSLTIDLQHGPVGYDAAVTLLQAIATTDKVPMARVPWNEPGIIMKMLDAGCYGIICPMINTEEECRRFVGACRYPPLAGGYRSIGPNRVRYYAGADYGAKANEAVLALAMIETREAVSNLDAILSVEGLDGVYIGPADLAQSYGRAPAADHTDPGMLEVIDTIRDKAKARGLVAGIHVASSAYGRQMIERGFDLITILSDLRLLELVAQKTVDEIKGTGVEAPKGPY